MRQRRHRRQVQAVDEARVVARKERNDTSDFFGPCVAAERNAFKIGMFVSVKVTLG
jgi:hypothetical protein